MGNKHSNTEASPQSIVRELKVYVDTRIDELRHTESGTSANDTAHAAVVEAYKRAYDDLYKRHEELLQSSTKVTVVKKKISDEAIDVFVKTLLTDPEINVHGLPDVVERVLYRKVLKIILGTLGHVADNAEIEFIGHKITIGIEPINSSNNGNDNGAVPAKTE